MVWGSVPVSLSIQIISWPTKGISLFLLSPAIWNDDSDIYSFSHVNRSFSELLMLFRSTFLTLCQFMIINLNIWLDNSPNIIPLFQIRPDSSWALKLFHVLKYVCQILKKKNPVWILIITALNTCINFGRIYIFLRYWVLLSINMVKLSTDLILF